MKKVYEECPTFESEKWLLRFVEKSDSDDLLQVYSDKNALPFFNSDNCDGDNFYYHTKELMNKAIDFWLYSYKEKWFVRWAIIEKSTGKAIGTIELFKRLSFPVCINQRRESLVQLVERLNAREDIVGTLQGLAHGIRERYLLETTV